MKRVMIAGASSWVGKTTICAGIMAAFNRRGRKVAPFKVGPDYIDPGFHKFVTNNPSYNLDSWLIDEKSLKFLFNRNTKDKDIAVIEGVMGLYDGLGIEKDQGSSAHVSKILKTPVILVINGKGISSSAAAQVMGYKIYDEEVDIKGVIVNRVSGDAHYKLLKGAIERDTGIPCVGYLPTNNDIGLESRHLGLIPIEELEKLDEKIEMLIEMVEEHIDLDLLEKIAENVPPVENTENPCKHMEGIARGLKIGIAKDKGFTFYYEDNIKLMKETGIELISFSPLKDKDIPEGLHGLYIGGGFPEIFSAELERNKEFRKNLKKHLEEGMPVYSECGGLMYLTEGIENLSGEFFKMTGFFPVETKMTSRLQRFGYVEVSFDGDITIRGHEFHHSYITENSELKYRYNVKKIRSWQPQKEWKCGLSKGNALGGYAHLHFYSNPKFLEKFINLCKERKDGIH